MSLPLIAWAEFREEMNPYIKQAGRKEISIEEFDEIVNQKIKELHKRYENNRTELIGWLGGDYDDLGFYDDKEDAERGHRPTEKFYELIDEKFKGRKVKITLEIIE